ncbi:MAG TPA: hypothetical protein VFJ18_14620 [Pararhizobium sp.]|nr:hypothetical protein [Pararhizobium sp.]
MSTIADALTTVALRCAVPLPNSWVASNTRIHVEIKSILAVTIDELLERLDWPEPIRTDYAITGTGVAAYDLPDDFKRLAMERGAVYETDTLKRCTAVGKQAIWTQLTNAAQAGAVRYYRVTGDEEDGYQIEFYPALTTSDSVSVAYISKNWLTNDEGTKTDVWDSETNTLLLPRRAVELGCIWRYRQQKGLPWEDSIAEYEAYLSNKIVGNLSGRKP